MSLDPDHIFRNQIESMLTTVSWVDQVKKMIGINGVSQIWEEAPAWYFWFAEAQGVYHLQLSGASLYGDPPQTALGTFTVKCYPYTDCGVFYLYSFQERHLVRSRFFDETHTPRFEERRRIPDSLFNVAVLEYELDLENNRAGFTLESLDTMRVRYETDTVQHYDLIGKRRRYRKGETDRSVPGWQMGYLFFDRFLSMHAFYSKAKPAWLRITRSEGFEYVYTDSNQAACVAAPNICCLSASVFCGLADGRHQGAAAMHAQRPADPDVDPDGSNILYEQAFTCDHYHSVGNRAEQKLPVHTHLNPLWWSLTDAEYKSHLGSACGCA